MATDSKFSFSPFAKKKKRQNNIDKLRLFLERAETLVPIEEGSFEGFEQDEVGELLTRVMDVYNILARQQSTLSKAENLAIIQAQEQVENKKRLTQNVNHELKTPVASIKGYLETIIQNPKMSDEQKMEFVNKSYEHTERLSSLLQDLSVITRMDEASDMIEKEEVILSNIISEILNENAFAADQKGISIHNEVPSGLKIVGNKALIQSIFYNLCQNAILYSGGDNIYVRLQDYTSKFYVFSFADDGVGIAPVHLNKIFERFYRIDKGRSRKLGGTGLGLSIVRNAVAIHGGTIRAKNRDEGGLEFIFSLALK